VSLVHLHGCHKLGWHKPKLDNMVCGVGGETITIVPPLFPTISRIVDGHGEVVGMGIDMHAHTISLHININCVTKVQV
jgi:hypothetical protein